MADRAVVVRLKAEIGQYQANLRKAQQATSEFGREISGRGKTAKADLEQVGRGALVMAAGIGTGFALSAKAAIDWESAWAGVTKTVDGSAAQMQELEDGLRDLAKSLPATHGEIAAVAEAAGQLGIKREAIESFTRTMIDLGETTNLTADEAATSMARMANIMQTPQADIERMASTLVALGNAGASTESEILDMAMRIAGSAKQVGISEDATLAFANALSSVGIEAEAGGTAISRVFSTIASSVAEGGESLDEFARIAGMSSAQFKTAFQQDAATATIAFIEGLDRIKGSGENVFAVLQDLELGDIRVRDALLRAAGAGDLFRESLALGADEWERNNALQTEAEKRYDTTAAKLEVARNQVTDLAINIGDQLLPMISAVAEDASTMAQGFGELPGPLQAAAQGVGGITLAASGAIAAAAILGPKILQVRTALLQMGAAGRVAAASMPWLAAAAAALGVVSYMFGENAREAEAAEEAAKGFADAIKEAGSEAGGVRSELERLARETPGMAEALDKTGTSIDQLIAAMKGSPAEFNDFAVGLYQALYDDGVRGPALEWAAHGLRGLQDEMRGGIERSETLDRVLGGVGDAAAVTAPKLGGVARELGLNADEAKRAKDEWNDLQDAYRAAVDPLFGMLDALESNREAMGAEAEARAENASRVSEAAEQVADAEADLRDARSQEDNAAGIAAAEERLAEARKSLAETEADSVLTAEELATMNRRVAESALDVETAARDLAYAVQDGTVDLEAAKGMLKEWEEQGIITAEQAASVADQFVWAEAVAGNYAGEYVANAVANTDTAVAAWQALYDKIKETYQLGYSTTGGAPISINQAEHSLGGARGGMVPGGLQPIYRAAGGPSGTDTVNAWLTPGEWVMQKSAVDRFGVGFMDAINNGLMPSGGGWGGGSMDYSRHVSLSAPITVADMRVAKDTAYELEKLAIRAGAL